MSGEFQGNLSSFKLARSEGKVRRLAATSSGDSSNSPKSSLKARDVIPTTRSGFMQSSLSDRKLENSAEPPSLSSPDDSHSTGPAIELILKTNDSKLPDGSSKSRMTPTSPSPAPSPKTISQPRGQSCYFDAQHAISSPSGTPRGRPVTLRTRSADI